MKAKRLKKGDTIGIVSPSGPVPSKDDECFLKGLKTLKKEGFSIVVGTNVFSKNPKERARDINEMFADKNINAIFSSKGGDTTQYTLPYIDWDIVKKNPKIFVGFSDNTSYINAIYGKTGLITFQGNDIRQGYGLQVNDYVLSELKSRLLEGKTGELPIKGERKTIIKGVAKGRLVGGNLRCLLKLKEFDFFPDFKDAILMIEAFNPTPKECRQMFSELKAYGIFDDVSGIIIGHIYGMEIENPNSEQMEEIILEFIKEKPILKCQLFGHNVPNTNLPIGAKVRVDATNKKIELIEKYIE